MKFRLLFLPLLLLSCGHNSFAEEIAFHKVSVEPLADASKQFIASGKRIDITFQSYSDAADADIDAFPEPPVILRDKKAETTCEIEEGGIWARAQVYLSSDEHYVLMNEFSGSGGDLVSYDTSTCREIRRLDVSGMHWHIDGGKARLGENCTGADMQSCASSRPLDLEMFVGKSVASSQQ